MDDLGLTAIAPFTVLGGATDYLLGAVAYGAQGAITGSANIAPRVCIKVFELASTGQAQKARDLALEISRAEWALGKGNILGTKVSLSLGLRDKRNLADILQYATVFANGYPEKSAHCRRPLPEAPSSTREHVKTECADLIALERQLEKEGFVGSSSTSKTSRVNGHA